MALACGAGVMIEVEDEMAGYRHLWVRVAGGVESRRGRLLDRGEGVAGGRGKVGSAAGGDWLVRWALEGLRRAGEVARYRASRQSRETGLMVPTF